MKSEIKSCSRNARKLEPEKNGTKSNALTQEIAPKLMDLYPVDPFTSGYGPPYAPDDWPCPGDKWKWSVGKKIKPTGFFQDRYLYPPPDFQRPYDGRAYIAVRSHIEKYIRKVFPDKDFVAFLASFSWDIPAKNFSSSKAKTAPRLSSKPQKMKEHKNYDDEEESAAAADEDQVEETTNTRKRKGKREPPLTFMCRRKTRHSFKCPFPSSVRKQPLFIDLTEEPKSEASYSSSKDNTEKTSKYENDKVSSDQNYVSSVDTAHSNGNYQESMNPHQEQFETNSEDPNLSIIPFVENKVDEAQEKTIDFSHVIITENLGEHTNVLSVNMEEYADDGYKKRAEEQNILLTYTRKRTRKPAPTSMYTQETKSEPSFSSCKDNTEEKSSKSENDKVSSHQNSVSSSHTSHSHANFQERMDAHQDPFETNSEDPGFSIIPLVENKVEEAQRKLASLLATNFNHSITTEHLAELTNVLLVIKKDDSHLSLAEHLKLHLIEEIPLLGSCFLEASQEMEFDNCCVSLVPNIAKVIPLIHCYNECKDKATQMQAEIDASLVAKRDLDEEIAKLQTQRAQLVSDVDWKINGKNDFISTQRSMADLITNVMGMIEVGSSKRHKLETRKAEVAKRVGEIIAEYTSWT